MLENIEKEVKRNFLANKKYFVFSAFGEYKHIVGIFKEYDPVSQTYDEFIDILKSR